MPKTLGKRHKTLGKWFVECNIRRTALAKKITAKPTLPSVFYWTLGKAFAECPTLGKAFAECPTLDKVGTEKTRKNENFYAKKMEIFLIGGGPHRPAPTHLRHFSRKIRGYAVLIE